MKTSANGRALLTQREGLKLKAYRDSRGIPTIGVGHVDMTPPVARMGMTITKAQADAFLIADLGQVEAVINTCVKVPISQNEFDAMASLGFNIGVGGLRRSSVIRKLNAGDVKGAANAFLMWSKPAVLAGRRRSERLQFLTPDPLTSKIRATDLAVKATASETQSKVAASTGDVAAATGGASVVAGLAVVPHTSHVFMWLLVAGLVIGTIGVFAWLFAASRRKAAATLVANAGQQSAIVEVLPLVTEEPPAPAPVPAPKPKPTKPMKAPARRRAKA